MTFQTYATTGSCPCSLFVCHAAWRLWFLLALPTCGFLDQCFLVAMFPSSTRTKNDSLRSVSFAVCRSSKRCITGVRVHSLSSHELRHPLWQIVHSCSARCVLSAFLLPFSASSSPLCDVSAIFDALVFCRRCFAAAHRGFYIQIMTFFLKTY